MQIKKLELENFMTYRRPTEIDFSGLTLFAISGKTGAGKSSIVDAICYALYGQIARLGKERGTREAIVSKGAQNYRVAITFSIGGDEYRIIRQGTATGVDAARIEKNGTPLKHLVHKTDIAAFIEKDLLGMDFSAFTRVIVLPQGQFDKFLKPDVPKDRRELLMSILQVNIYADIGNVARKKLDDLKSRIAALETQLGAIKMDDLSDEHLADMVAQSDMLVSNLERLRTRSSTLDMSIERMGTLIKKAKDLADATKHLSDLQSMDLQMASLEQEIVSARYVTGIAPSIRQLDTAEKQLRDVDSLLQSVHREHEIASHAEATASINADIYEKKYADESYEKRIEELVDHSRSFSDKYAEPALVMEQQTKQISTLESSLADNVRKHDGFTNQMHNAEKALAIAQLNLFSATSTKKAADLAYDNARINNTAATIQQSLHVGDTCPVCGEIIKNLAVHSTENLDQLQALASTATASVEKAQLDIHEIEGTIERMHLFIDAGAARKDEIQEELKIAKSRFSAAALALPVDIASAVNPHAAYLVQFEGINKDLRVLQNAEKEDRKARDTALKNLSIAQAALSKVNATRSAHQASHDRLSDQVTHLKDFLEKELERMKIANIQEALSYVRNEYQQADMCSRHDAFVLDKNTTQTKCDVLTADLSGAVVSEEEYKAQLVERTEISTAIRTTETEVSSLRNQHAVLLARKQSSIALSAERLQLLDECTSYDTIQKDFSSRGIVSYVSNGILSNLLEAANRHMGNLSSKRFSFVMGEDDNLQVMDSNTSAPARDVATLSGGETFLASLALALSVKDLLSANTQFNAFFIDEGFGTLDPDYVTLVADALQSLRSESGQVGIITHSNELTKRFDTILKVENRHGESSVQIVYPSV